MCRFSASKALRGIMIRYWSDARAALICWQIRETVIVEIRHGNIITKCCFLTIQRDNNMLHWFKTDCLAVWNMLQSIFGVVDFWDVQYFGAKFIIQSHSQKNVNVPFHEQQMHVWFLASFPWWINTLWTKSVWYYARDMT